MAEVHIYRAQFIANNPYGTFVAGDTLDVYFETTTVLDGSFVSTDGIIAKHNGTPIVSGPGLFDSSVMVEQVIVNEICSGTTLVQFGSYVVYPYRSYGQYTDHYSCVINSPTCDLIVSGTPLITAASTATTADGEVLVSATSRNAIQYKLGADFTYNDGTGQGTGLFVSLLPGSYRIFLRDSANCAANISVTIGIDNSSSAIYRHEYYDYNGKHTKIEIQERAYSGSVTDVEGGVSPFLISLRGEGELDKFYPLMAISAQMEIVSETDFQFQSLYTTDPDKYRMVYFKDLGAGYTTIWTGKVLANQSSEQYRAVPYFTSITATDGLAELKDIVFAKDDGLPFAGKMKQIELIAYILKKTGIPLDIRVAINLYATPMNQTASDDPLDQAYVDLETYYLTGEIPTLDFVLSAVLEPYGARILQWRNRWNILRVEELIDSYDYRQFDMDGVYSSNGSANPRTDIKIETASNALWFAESNHVMELKPGYGKISVDYKLGLKENIFRNGNFSLTSVYNPGNNSYSFNINTLGFQIVSPDYAIFTGKDQISDENVGLSITGLTDTTGEAYVISDTYNVKMGVNTTLKFTFSYKVPPPYNGLNNINAPYQKVRVKVKYGIYYLTSDGNWSTDDNAITFYVTEFGKYIHSEIIAVQPVTGSSAGFDLYGLVYHSYVFHTDYNSFANLKAVATTAIPLGVRTEVWDEAEVHVSDDRIYYYELEEDTSAENIPEIIRPTDYNAVTNPVQWIKKANINKSFYTNFRAEFSIDKILCEYQVNGKIPTDEIKIQRAAQAKNKQILEKTIYHGSYETQLKYLANFGIALNVFQPIDNNATFQFITETALSADIIYAGYLRDSAGIGYTTWKRDSVSESTSLQNIYMAMYTAQYNRSFRLMTGSFLSDTFFGFDGVMCELNDEDRLYLPMGVTLDDKNCMYRGEFLELIDITEGGGIESGGTAGFTRGFSLGFNS